MTSTVSPLYHYDATTWGAVEVRHWHDSWDSILSCFMNLNVFSVFYVDVLGQSLITLSKHHNFTTISFLSFPLLMIERLYETRHRSSRRWVECSVSNTLTLGSHSFNAPRTPTHFLEVGYESNATLLTPTLARDLRNTYRQASKLGGKIPIRYVTILSVDRRPG